jgi:hypothetical protein
MVVLGVDTPFSPGICVFACVYVSKGLLPDQKTGPGGYIHRQESIVVDLFCLLAARRCGHGGRSSGFGFTVASSESSKVARI